MKKAAYDRKTVFSWCMFDFANSGYSAVIAAVVFPVFYTSYIVGNDGGLGDLWWGRAISLSMMVVALASPVLGGLADYSGFRKRFLLFFTALCIVSVAMLGLLEKGMYLEGFALVVLANIGLEGGLAFYNAYLPEIAPRSHQGRVSAWGFGIGYAGSMLSLLIALPLVKAGHYAATWLMVSALFALFSAPAFMWLPADHKSLSIAQAGGRAVGFTVRTFLELWKRREARRFLIAYLIYADGVNTVIVFSSIFASATLGFATAELVALYIVVQGTALAGSFAMGPLMDSKGPKFVVMLSLLMWSAVCVAAFFVTEKTQFWVVATLAGLALGTVQAASRAFYAQFVPEGHEAEYFGVYALVGKTSAVIGPLMFGYISSTMGSQRPAILSVALFFIAGLAGIAVTRAGGPNISRQSEST